MTPNEIFFGIIAAAFIALVACFIWLAARIGETMKTANKVLENTDQALRETIGEVNQNLRSLRIITDNISIVTTDATSFSGSIRDMGDEVRRLTGNVREIGDVVHSLGTETIASVCGLRAGFRTGFDVLLKSLFQQRTSR
jgi:uncharacterized protein YoxC